MSEKADQEKKPAAYEDAQADTRSAAKWLIAAFAAVGAALLSGIGLSGLGTVEGVRLAIAVCAFILGSGGVIVAVSLITDVLTPAPVTIAKLARYAERRNQGKKRGRNDELLRYIEDDPSFLQGMVDRASCKRGDLLIAANNAYNDAVDERFKTAEEYWKRVKEDGAKSKPAGAAKEDAQVASSRVETMHETVRRLEQIATSQQTVIAFRQRRAALAGVAVAVAISIGAFAIASNEPEAATADLGGADLEEVDLSGVSLRGVDLSEMTLRGTNFEDANLEGAEIDKTKWEDVICPDGANSDTAGGTCENHLSPDFKPGALP